MYICMASSPFHIDSLSALPDEVLITILSLLSTREAARTSVLSHRFRHPWKASHSVDLRFAYRLNFKHSTYISMANSVLLSRTPSNPLLHLNLELGSPLPCELTDSFICSLLVHAHALGLRHLTIHRCVESEPVLCYIFSISTLESLSFYTHSPFPSQIACTSLRSLSILFLFTTENSTQFQWLLSELCCLEDLQLIVSSYMKIVRLSSRTIKKLELCFYECDEMDSLELSMPSLEFINLKTYPWSNFPLIHGENIPFIRKAVVTLHFLCQEQVTAVAQLLNFISHVEELSLDLEEHKFSDNPFSVLMEPGKEVPSFPNLKHLNVDVRFHDFNFAAVVRILHNCPVLESLKLHHKNGRDTSLAWKRLFFPPLLVPCFNRTPATRAVKDGKRNIAWRSELPRNRDGNYQYACFKNLHLGENREEFEKLLNKKCTPKKAANR